MVRKLREAGQKDVWWLTSGDHKDEVSVGIFQNEDYAKARQQTMVKSGFAAQVVPREIERRAFWLDLREAASHNVTVELVEKLRERHKGLTAETKRCPRSPL